MTKQMQYKDCLTNEMLHKRFKSQFDLVRFAINVAEDRINAQRNTSEFHIEDKSLASEILEDIAEGKTIELCCKKPCATECKADEEQADEKPKARSKKPRF